MTMNTAAAVLFISGIALVPANKRFTVFAVSIFPTMDIITDINYLLSTNIYNSVLFSLILISVLATNCLFFYRLTTARGKVNGRPPFPLMIKRACPLVMYVDKKIFWLRSSKGYPVIFGDMHIVLFSDHDSLPMLLILLLTWVFAVMVQGLYLVLFLLWAAVASMFLIVWLLLGMWTFQNKTLALKSVWNSWFYVWTGRDEFDKEVEIDVRVLNESLFTEFMVETLPQMALQFTNNELTMSWNGIGIFSILFSSCVAFNGAYSYIYWVFFRHYDFSEVPAEVSFLGFCKVSIEYESQTGKGLAAFDDLATKRERTKLAAKIWTMLTTYNKELRVAQILFMMGIASVESLPSLALDPANEVFIKEIEIEFGHDSEAKRLLQKYIKQIKEREFIVNSSRQNSTC
jgi:hypothetical protein